MPPIVCIVGRPKSGKTTLIDGLIPELGARGYRVATIKHTTHDFETDTPGKDSWKHAQAGSECAVLSSANKVALYRNVDHDLSPTELARLISDDFDIVIAEGFKQSKELKIEVHRHQIGQMVCAPEQLLAVVTDEPMELDVPCLSLDDIAGLADLIEEKVLRSARKIAVFADGKPVPLNRFVRDIFHKTISGMVSSLKGVKDPANINITIKK